MTNHDDQLDLLITRIADGEATEQDWATFSDLASRTPDAWKSLAQTQREHQSLALAVGVALHAADYVDLPSREVADAFLRRGRYGQRFVWSRVRQASGWAVAALLALAWLTTQLPGMRTNTSPQNVAGVPSNYFKVDSADDALQIYRDKGTASGRVLGEMPVLVESRPATTGRGFEVVYVRQFLEREHVSDLVRFARDEADRPHPVRVTAPARAGQAE